ncbi:glycosyltransferase family 2 protein [Porphyrobacter sp. CACIAM 03H1]|uniref:glycosyltransferase family 2 protein n=1 Tax=Porphyrobacter sp. CACIAM 03H1 TaxID=2003315 RepID=UPI001F413215|nr:glycosyltransferase [Porphyrobacter sp. CACIAM 03H1]
MTIRVHIDAFLIDPFRYLTAWKWRILGKRVRASGQFAALLAGSPRAYDFWILILDRSQSHAKVDRDVPIVALVQDSDDHVAVDATLRSLAASGIQSLVIGSCVKAILRRILGGADRQQERWIMLLQAGDLLSPRAAASYLAAIETVSASCTVIYADDDALDHSGRRTRPHLKPDWNSELQGHFDFVTGACIVRADAVDLADADGTCDWTARMVSGAARRGTVSHIPKILHHRRARPLAPAKVDPVQVASHLPLVSVIIPTRNRVTLLRTCITGLRATRYPGIEIIVANNDSDDPETLAYLGALAEGGVTIVDQPGPFNYSAINNNAVALARGELICLMNNDIEVLSPDWLAIMATQAMRPEVGAVGAQLLYPDGRIQHAGVVIGVGNAAGHAHRFLRPEAEGYFRRHSLPQYVSAVTAACLVVRRDRFLAVGGLNASNFPVAFNDVDLCLKLNQRGWQSFYEPRAVLLHHESVSRGLDTDPVGAARFAGELAALQRIWRTDEITDPFHHPMLSRASEQFALDLTPAAVPA